MSLDHQAAPRPSGQEDESPPSQPPPGYSLAFSHITKRYGDRTVVDDLTFTVQPGRVTGFLGRNGAGKSTTMKVLLGLASADQGRATIGGRSYRDLPNPARTVGVVLEPNAFHPGRSGRNHLRIVADAAGIDHSRVDAILDSVNLADDAADRRVGTYSLGMKQRLSLAAALLGDPQVLVLDEPANGLDPQGIRTLRELLRARAARGHTVLVSSHLLDEVEHLVDDVVVINEGKLIATGTIHDLQRTSALVRTGAPDKLDDVLTAAGARVEHKDQTTLVVTDMAVDEIGEQAFVAGVPLHELSPQKGSLEDLFLEWTARQANGEMEETLS